MYIGGDQVVLNFIFFDNITVRRAIGEREIKYHFISRRTIVRRAIKLTLFPADVELKSKREKHGGLNLSFYKSYFRK